MATSETPELPPEMVEALDRALVAWGPAASKKACEVVASLLAERENEMRELLGDRRTIVNDLPRHVLQHALEGKPHAEEAIVDAVLAAVADHLEQGEERA